MGKLKLKNYVEDIVVKTLDELLEGRDDICQCDKCKSDMVALTLSRIPPKYATTEEGRILATLESENVQFTASVISELFRSIGQVSQNPKHDKD